MLLRLLLLAVSVPALLLSAEGEPKNVIMIAVDDLRPMLGCYGDTRMKTPNIDRLARSGMIFEHAYCNYSKCGPSRLSLMTGLRPGSVQVYGHGDAEPAAFRARRPDAISVARWLKDHGYETRSFGKIDHDGWQVEGDWSRSPFAGREGEILEITDEENPDKPTIIANRQSCPVLQAPDVNDDHLFDGRMTGEAINQLHEVHRKNERPFFFAIGYRRPHLPFVAPKRYFELYEEDNSWLAHNPDPPQGSPPFAWFNSDGYGSAAKRAGLTIPEDPDRATAIALNGYEMRSYLDVPHVGPIPEERQIQLVRAYAACVSYVDAQIGRILDALDESGLRENTIVILWSDHGWHLGEMSAWGKMTNYEVGTRVPLIVSVPGLAGGRAKSIVELVDLYPTICDLTGVKAPPHLEGESFVPVLEDPGEATDGIAIHDYVRHRGRHFGRAVRVPGFRLVRWYDPEGQVEFEELYDLEKDPNETVNIARENPEQVEALREMLE